MRNDFYGEDSTEVKKRKMNMKKFELICYTLGICYWLGFMYSL